MPPIFSFEKRAEIKINLLEIGIRIIKTIGVRKMSIDKITNEAGIGKGTFYHFFESKEQFVMEVIRYSKESIYKAINELVTTNSNIDKQAFLGLLHNFSFTGSNNIFSFMSKEDEIWLRKNCHEEFTLDAPKEEDIMRHIFQHVKGLRVDINYHVVANTMKLFGLMMEHKEELHQDVLKETQNLIVDSLCDYIFE